MDKIVKKLVALVLTLSMTLSLLPSGVLAAFAVEVPDVSAGDSTVEDSAVDDSTSVSVSVTSGTSGVTLEGDYTTAEVKSDLRRIILLEDDTVVNVSKYGISASDMKTLVAEVLEENYLTSFVTVKCAVNGDGIATHLVIQRSEALSAAKDEMGELSENAPATVNPDEGVSAAEGEGEGGQATGLSDDEMQELLSLYALYLQTYVDYPQYLGVLDPYFYTKNTDTSPMGAMLVVAGIPQAAIDYGQVGYNDLFGCIMTFYLGNMATVQFYGSEITNAKDEALKAIEDSGAKTDVDKLMVLTDWLANRASFDMPYIMNQSQKDDEGNYIEMMAAEAGTEENPYLASGELKSFCENILHEIFKQGAMEDGREEGYKVGYAAYVKENYEDYFNMVANAQCPEDETKTVYEYIYDMVYGQVKSAALEQGASEEQAAAQADHIATVEADYEVAKQVVDLLDNPPATEADATLNIVINDENGNTLGSTTITQTGTQGETAVFEADEIKTATEAVVLSSEDYELGEQEYKDTEVAFGEALELSFTAVKKVVNATATLTINIVDVDADAEDAPLATTQLTKDGPEGSDVEFSAEEIQNAAKEVDLASLGYELTEQTYPSATVKYGQSDSVDVEAKAVKDPESSETPESTETPEDESTEPASQPTPAADADAEVMPVAEPVSEDEGSSETAGTTVAEAADAYANAYAEQYAEGYADNYADQMDEPFAEALAPQVVGSWTGNHVGALCLDSCVCKAYTYAFNFIVQWMNPGVYGVNGQSTDLSKAENWKSADDLFYDIEVVDAKDENGNTLTDDEGNKITTEEKTFNIDKGYVVDSVRITYNTSVTMYGEKDDNFSSDHYWSAVKVDGEWYYIDSCYADIYIECMMRSRVETDGYINNLYFMISDASAREMYDGYFDSESGLDTLYDSRNNSGISDDTSYEHTWFSYAKSQVYSNGSGYYYMYDDTDALNELGKKNSQNADDWNNADEPTEYKLVYRPMDSKNSDETGGDSYDLSSDKSVRILVDVNEGTYRDAEGNMVESELLKELYTRYLEYAENYPAVFVSMAYHDGIAYLSLGNTILAYDVDAGTLTRVLEYNEVYAVRDKHNAFGGRAFTVTDDADGADLSITNPPIAAINIVGDELTVTLATNYAFISGKDSVDDKDSYGYEFQETNYNASYINYSDYGVDLGNSDYGDLSGMIDQEDNDNDEFMWAANFVDTLSVSELAGSSHNYEKVTVAPACGIDGYTEERCSDCGRINPDVDREVAEGTALEHHFIHFEETYYTKEDGQYKSGETYVCADCLHSVNDLSDDEDADNSEWEALVSGETASGHVYELVGSDDQIIWAEDNGSVTITGGTLVCPTCDGNLLDFLVDDPSTRITADGEISVAMELEEEMVLEAAASDPTGTCTDGMTTVYTAKGTYNDLDFTVSKSVTTEPGEHVYEATFEWVETQDEDGTVTGYTGATAVLTCISCGDQIEELTAEVTSETTDASCGTDGKTVYTATVEYEGTTYTDTKEVVIPAIAHDYSVKFTWDEEQNTATAVLTCGNCGTEVKDLEADVACEITKEATCTEDGTGVYTASVEYEGTTYTDAETGTREVVIPAKGHVYEEPVFTWSEDKSMAVATFTCTEGDDTVTLQCDVEHKVTEPTYAEDGSDAYIATVIFNDVTYVDIESETLPKKVLSTPSLTKASNAVSGVTVTWGAVEGAEKYQLWRKVPGGSWAKVENGLVTSTSCTDKTAESGTTYVYTVRAIAGSAMSGFDSKGISVNYLATPTLTKTENVDGGLTVTWGAVAGAETYQLWRKAPGGSWGKVGSPTTSASYTDKTVQSGTTYVYTVRAISANAMSDFDRTGLTIMHLSAPTVTKAINLHAGIQLTWTEVPGCNGYNIYRKLSGGGYSLISVAKGSDNTSYTDASVQAEGGNTYTYKIMAYKSSYKSVYTASSPIVRMDTPTIKSLTQTSNGVVIKWNSITGCNGYNIYRKLGNGSYVKLGNVTGSTANSFTDTRVKGKIGTYTYKIEAYRSQSKSACHTKTITLS